MYCPSCKKDTGISEGSPQVDRVRVNALRLLATVQITDVCDSCYRSQQEAKFEIERGLESVPELQGHHQHAWKAEGLATERLPGPPGFVTVKLSYGVTCECGRVPMYEADLTKSAALVPVP